MVDNIKFLIFCNLFFFINEISFCQNFDKSKSLKFYSRGTVITTQVRSERNKAILRGPGSKENRDFVQNKSMVL